MALALLTASTLVGCGRTATEEDCERIVVRMTELELKASNVTDPETIEHQVAVTKHNFKDRALKECVGRQISRGAIECVESATSSEQILQECLN